MATAIHTFFQAGRRGPFTTPAEDLRALRARLETLVTNALELLDGLDGDADLEPDTEGEGAPDEASVQPATLCPDRCPAVTHRPSRRAMRAAYRLNGDPIPANLRSFAGLFGGRRA